MTSPLRLLYSAAFLISRMLCELMTVPSSTTLVSWVWGTVRADRARMVSPSWEATKQGLGGMTRRLKMAAVCVLSTVCSYKYLTRPHTGQGLLPSPNGQTA